MFTCTEIAYDPCFLLGEISQCPESMSREDFKEVTVMITITITVLKSCEYYEVCAVSVLASDKLLKTVICFANWTFWIQFHHSHPTNAALHTVVQTNNIAWMLPV